MVSQIWRFAVSISDWKTSRRKVIGDPILDVVFISNMRDQTDRRRYLEQWHPPEGHFNGSRYWINSTAGRTRAIDSTTDEFNTNQGRQKAKEQFISATQ